MILNSIVGPEGHTNIDICKNSCKPLASCKRKQDSHFTKELSVNRDEKQWATTKEQRVFQINIMKMHREGIQREEEKIKEISSNTNDYLPGKNFVNSAHLFP